MLINFNTVLESPVLCREWYDKLALVLMTHSVKSQETYEVAMNVVIRGLHDKLTHLSTFEIRPRPPQV